MIEEKGRKSVFASALSRVAQFVPALLDLVACDLAFAIRRSRSGAQLATLDETKRHYFCLPVAGHCVKMDPDPSLWFVWSAAVCRIRISRDPRADRMVHETLQFLGSGAEVAEVGSTKHRQPSAMDRGPLLACASNTGSPRPHQWIVMLDTPYIRRYAPKEAGIGEMDEKRGKQLRLLEAKNNPFDHVNSRQMSKVLPHGRDKNAFSLSPCLPLSFLAVVHGERVSLLIAQCQWTGQNF